MSIIIILEARFRFIYRNFVRQAIELEISMHVLIYMLILRPILDKNVKILDFQSKTFTKAIISSSITFVKVLEWKSEI